MKLLFFGDKPSTKNIDPKIPFLGTQSAKRLNRWFNMIAAEMALLGVEVEFHVRNSHEPELLGNIEQLDLLIALGNNASKRLVKAGLRHWKLPHPSNRNRMWNDPMKEVSEILSFIIYLKKEIEVKNGV